MTQGGEDSIVDLPVAADNEIDDDSEMIEEDRDIDESDIINEEEIVVNYLHME